MSNYKTNPIKLNRSKISPMIIAILDKFKSDKHAYALLKDGYLKLASHKVMQDSMQHTSFCDYFPVSKKLPDLLLKLYGLNERELKHEMEQFSLIGSIVYTKDYYITLLMAYLIGLDNNDEELRQYALLLISILIWNYYKLRYFPNVCDPKTSQYVMNYELQGNHTFKSAGTPLNYIMKVTIPALENGYPERIAKDPTEHYEGLKRVITVIRPRFNQLFKNLAKNYYKAIESGKSESVHELRSKSYENSGEMVEKKEHFNNIIERLSDKIIKNGILKSKVIEKSPIKDMLYKKFFLSNQVFQKIDKYLDDDQNQEDLKYYIELLLNGLKLKSEDELCTINMEVLANRITSSRKNEYYDKLKKFNTSIAISVLHASNEDKGHISTQNEYRYSKIMITAILSYIKFLNCKSI